MNVSVLAVTPQPNFGHLIRQSLTDAGKYQVHVVETREEAIEWLESTSCTFAFLDTDLTDSILSLGLALRQIKPDLGLVIISGAGLPPALDELRPWVLLRKPFYMPDLLNMLETGVPRPDGKQATDSLPNKAQTSEAPEPIWLRDVTRAAQHLTRLTLESSAQAALIAREGQLWAYAGQLSQAAAQELSQSLTRGGWMGEGDLLRFVHLKATSAEHMLYATNLNETLILALVFDAETPFSTIRTQANSLAHSLFATQYETGPVNLPPELLDNPAENPDEEEPLPKISDILSDVPPPIPARARQGMLATKDTPAMPFNSRPFVRQETSPAIPLPAMKNSEQAVISEINSGQISVDTDELEETRISQVDLEETRLSNGSQLDPTRQSHIDLGETRRSTSPEKELFDTPQTDQSPKSVTEVVARRIVVEPASPAMYNLTYACLLVPRFHTHYLTGDLASSLSDWLQEICISYGWRLEAQAVRPEYLQWVVNVPPATSPGYLMRIIRQKTSENIMADFPRLKRENPAGDFWAPGYLIMGGSQPHPQQLVNDYIKQTRQRQGITGPKS